MGNPWWYILYNHFLWLLFFLICYNNYRKNISILGPYKGNCIEKPVFLLFIILVFYTLFNFSGGDEDRYRFFVEYGFMNYGEKEHDPIETLYVFLAALSSRNFLIWKIYVYGGAILLTFSALWRLKSFNYISLMGFSLFAMGTYGHSRGVLAFAIFLFGYSFIRPKKKISTIIGFLIIYVSHFAHSSMVLPIVLSFFIFFKFTKTRIRLLLMAFPLVVLLFNIMIPYLSSESIFMDTHAGYKFETYTEEGTNAGSSYGRSIMAITYEIYGLFVIGSLTYYAVKAELIGKLPYEISKITRVSFYLVYVSFVIYFSSLSTTLAVFQRYFTMAPFFLFITIPCLFTDRRILSMSKRNYLIWLFFSYRFLSLLISTYYRFSKG